MSLLTPAVQVLDKGLNLQTAKIIAPPGSVLDSVNYEQVDFQGQKRIDGFTRYDGNLLSVEESLYLIDQSSGVFTQYGDLAYYNDSLLGVYLEGYEVSSGDIYDLVAVYDYRLAETIPNAVSLYKYPMEPEEMMEIVDTSMNRLRERVEKLPGQVTALHWFGDRLYAVADAAVVQVSSSEYTAKPGDSVEVLGEFFPILAVPDPTLLVIGTSKLNYWIDAGVDYIQVRLYNSTYGHEVYVENWQPDINKSEYFGTFFEARSESQVLREDGEYYDLNNGWKFKHTGWLLDFEQGTSAFGSFPSVNQNLQGLGVQGPTDIGGAAGSPNTLLQAALIQGEQTQVNGWKSSGEDSAYVLRTANVRQSGDSAYVYADSYVQWRDGEYTSPDQNAAPTEYSATNYVEVTDIV